MRQVRVGQVREYFISLSQPSFYQHNLSQVSLIEPTFYQFIVCVIVVFHQIVSLVFIHMSFIKHDVHQ